jgi:hypothetical protein
MEEDYATAIAQTSPLLSTLIQQQHDLIVDAVNIDAIVKGYLQKIGQALTQQLLTEACHRLADQARQQGLSGDENLIISISTVFGEVTLPSPYLRNRATGQTARPVSDALGLRNGSRTPALERALTDFGAEQSFARAADRFKEHYGFAIHRDRLRRTTHRRAQQATEYLRQRLKNERAAYDLPTTERPGADVILVELDGSLLRTGRLVKAAGDEKTAKRGIPRKRREEAWREVRVGFARQQEESEKRYVARMSEYSTVCDDLFSIAVERGLSKDSTVISVSDGGNGLRDRLRVAFPGLRYLLDLPHLKSHLYETAGELSLEEDDRPVWVEEILAGLWSGDQGGVFGRLDQIVEEGSDRARQLVGFLRRFSDSLDYGGFHERGWPLGSGEIESAHRYISQQRLKLPGTWWRPDNIDPMLALRVVRANQWWDDFWEWEKQQRRAA